MEFISHTPLSLFTYDDLHELHVYCGWVILIDGVLHTMFHIFRWANQGNLNLLFEQFSGISGVIIIISTLLVCVPMIFLKKHLTYEIRKILHYFFILMAIALCYHSTQTSIPNGGFSVYVFSIILGWYFLDTLYIYCFMTEKIESTIFHVVPTGVQLTMTVSPRFQAFGGHGGYCYVCFPWISKTEWHAFSLFENPNNRKFIYLIP
jgi:ferric-chelate reductase